MANEREIKHGMWVIYNKKCGITYQWAEPPGSANPGRLHREVHLVDDNGLTALVVPVESFAGLKQAALEDIPAKRRPPKRQGQALGYFTRKKS